MAIPNRFQGQQPAASSGPSAVPYRSRHAGVPANTRDPYLAPCDTPYVIEVLSTRDSSLDPGVKKAGKGSFIISLKVVESAHPDYPAGTRATITQSVVGGAEETGRSQAKCFLIAACGFEKEEEFDAAEIPIIDGAPPIPRGETCALVFWDAVDGRAEAERYYGPNPLAGAKAKVLVERGNAQKDKATGLGTGRFFNKYFWAPYAGE